jgi:hypothetical protein
MTQVTLDIDGNRVKILEGPYIQDGQPTPHAREFASTLVRQLDEMRAFAATEYLALYNDTWRDEEEGDPLLDEHEFRARLIGASIVLYDELGSATVFFGDSGMFAGHSIMISVDGGTIRDASLVG